LNLVELFHYQLLLIRGAGDRKKRGGIMQSSSKRRISPIGNVGASKGKTAMKNAILPKTEVQRRNLKNGSTSTNVRTWERGGW